MQKCCLSCKWFAFPCNGFAFHHKLAFPCKIVGYLTIILHFITNVFPSLAIVVLPCKCFAFPFNNFVFPCNNFAFPHNNFALPHNNFALPGKCRVFCMGTQNFSKECKISAKERKTFTGESKHFARERNVFAIVFHEGTLEAPYF